MWLPEWLYGRLPALYLAAAVASLWWLGMSLATALSSLSLFGAAVLTLAFRRDARRPLPPPRRRPAAWR